MRSRHRLEQVLARPQQTGRHQGPSLRVGSSKPEGDTWPAELARICLRRASTACICFDAGSRRASEMKRLKFASETPSALMACRRLSNSESIGGNPNGPGVGTLGNVNPGVDCGSWPEDCITARTVS